MCDCRSAGHVFLTVVLLSSHCWPTCPELLRAFPSKSFIAGITEEVLELRCAWGRSQWLLQLSQRERPRETELLREERGAERGGRVGECHPRAWKRAAPPAKSPPKWALMGFICIWEQPRLLWLRTMTLDVRKLVRGSSEGYWWEANVCVEEISGIWKCRSCLPNAISPAQQAARLKSLCLPASWASSSRMALFAQGFREFSVASKLGTFTSCRNANS